jgi:hypothetical protein
MFFYHFMTCEKINTNVKAPDLGKGEQHGKALAVPPDPVNS